MARRKLFTAALLGSANLMIAPAHAQDNDEVNDTPRAYFVDDRGVDIANTKLALSSTLLSIGPGGKGDLSYSRTYEANRWITNVTNVFEQKGNTSARARLGPDTWHFNTVGGMTGTFNPTMDNRVSMVYSSATNNYTLTTPDGDIATFSRTLADYSGDNGYYTLNNNLGRLTSLVSPSGVKTTMTYRSVTLCVVPTGGGACINRHFARPQSLTNNLGYQLKFDYETNSVSTPAGLGSWRTVTKITAINNAVDACPPAADTCPAFSTVWPSVTLATTPYVGTAPGNRTHTFLVTDQTGQTIEYGYMSTWNANIYPSGGWNSARIVSIKNLANPAGVINYSYANGASYRVTGAANAAGAWTYDYSGSTGMKVTTVNPQGGTKIVRTDYEYNDDEIEDQTITDELLRVTRYDYSDDGWRVERITRPEGDYTDYLYATRDNLIGVTHVAKAGSGLPNITTSTVFPATCTNRVLCDKPIARIDARGAQTDYTYDPVHGGMLTETGPAPVAGGVRPQITYSYGTVAGTDGTPIYRLTSKTEKIDATSSTVTTYGYDAMHRLAVKEIVTNSGGGNFRTCFQFDKLGRKIAQTEARAGVGKLSVARG